VCHARRSPGLTATRGFLGVKRTRLFEAHVAPLNRLVERLREEGRPSPWFDPDSGGTSSRVMFLLESPGPMASAAHGSGLISIDNDDQTAARFFRLTQEAGLDRGAYLNWNVVPWYVSTDRRNQNAAPVDFVDAEPWLHDLLGLLPSLDIVVTMGNFARDCWVRYLRHDDAPLLRLAVTAHPSASARRSRPSFEQDIAGALVRVTRALD